jgi:imidazolonepropionase-like amidohydrolase
MTNPVTANVWAEHSIWPQDPGFSRALAGGITSLQILPGSGNLVGGRGVTLKNVYSTSYQGMKFPDAPYGMKMACGENPKRVYGARKQLPSTRMGNMAAYRAQWIEAQAYQQEWKVYEDKLANGTEEEAEEAKAPKVDLRLQTLAGVLNGEIIVHMHCYRADEMLTILDMANEFNYKVGSFHHGVEAYKIADELAENNVCGALWADWWGFKMEAYDGIQENIAIVDRPEGSCAVVHSDSSEGIQRLNQEAAKAMTRGNAVGMNITPEHAIEWITINAAKSLGVEEQTGSLEAGKMADVVIWNQNPFSVYAKAEQVFIDGAMMYDINNPALQPVSDFELGQLQGASK